MKFKGTISELIFPIGGEKRKEVRKGEVGGPPFFYCSWMLDDGCAGGHMCEGASNSTRSFRESQTDGKALFNNIVTILEGGKFV